MKKYWLSFSLIAFFLLIVFLADSGNLPRSIRKLYDFPYGDKLGHFLLTGLLSYVLNKRAILTRQSAHQAERNASDLNLARVLLTVSLLLAFFITLEEFSQQLFPIRTFSLSDLVAGYAGIAFFAWLALKRTKKVSVSGDFS